MSDDEPKFVEYPKYVDHPDMKDSRGYPLRVVVKNADEEAELFGNKSEDKEPKGKAPKGGWPVK